MLNMVWYGVDVGKRADGNVGARAELGAGADDSER